MRVDPMEVRLARAAVVRGRVEDHDGPTVGVRVGLFQMVGGGLVNLPDDEAVTREDGIYLLRAREDGSYFVAAVHSGYLAAGRSHKMLVAQVIDAAPLRMERGVTLSGHVFVNGEPAPGARVEAAPASRGGHLLNWKGLLWSDKAITRGRIAAKAGEKGRFLIEGLEAGACRVAVTWLPGGILAGIVDLERVTGWLEII